MISDVDSDAESEESIYVIGSEKRDHFARAGDFLFST